MENLGIFSAASDNYPHTHIFGYESKTSEKYGRCLIMLSALMTWEVGGI